MANIKISELSNAGALNGTEVLPIVQGNATVKTTTQNIANLLGINYTPENVANKSTDTTLSANSDTLYPSQKAIKAYVDGTVVSAIKDNGNWDASGNLFPNVNSQNQPITKGDLWYISVGGTLGGTPVLAGYSIRALVNNPQQNAANWGILNVGLGYVPENVANKSTDGTLSANSDTLYPSQKAVRTYVNSISAPTPTLQQVTTAGATTTSNLVVNQLATAVGSSLLSTGRLVAKDIVLQPTIGSATNQLTFNSSLITGNKTYTLPNANGTIALTSDLAPYLTTASATATYVPYTGGSTALVLNADITTSFSLYASGLNINNGNINVLLGNIVTNDGYLGVNISGSVHASAVTQIDSTNQGFLPPRMTESERTSISSPAIGLIVYQTDSGGDGEGVYVYRSSGWQILQWGGL